MILSKVKSLTLIMMLFIFQAEWASTVLGSICASVKSEHHIFETACKTVTREGVAYVKTKLFFILVAFE